MFDMNVGILFRTGMFCTLQDCQLHPSILQVFLSTSRTHEPQAWLLYSLCPSTHGEIDRIETPTTVAQGAHHPDRLRLCQRTTCCATERAVYHDAARSAEEKKKQDSSEVESSRCKTGFLI